METPKIRQRSRPDTEKVREAYDVGYGKPPERTRFRPGQSGNPKGRKRGTKNLTTIVEELLAEKVTVMLRGQEKRITQAEVIGRRLVKLAADGNPRMLAILLSRFQQESTMGRESPPEQSDRPLTEAEQSVMEELMAIAREVPKESSGEGGAGK